MLKQIAKTAISLSLSKFSFYLAQSSSSSSASPSESPQPSYPPESQGANKTALLCHTETLGFLVVGHFGAMTEVVETRFQAMSATRLPPFDVINQQKRVYAAIS